MGPIGDTCTGRLQGRIPCNSHVPKVGRSRPVDSTLTQVLIYRTPSNVRRNGSHLMISPLS
jgi:hypothetical protein